MVLKIVREDPVPYDAAGATDTALKFDSTRFAPQTEFAIGDP